VPAAAADSGPLKFAGFELNVLSFLLSPLFIVVSSSKVNRQKLILNAV
jgi:hypothetical protein